MNPILPSPPPPKKPSDTTGQKREPPILKVQGIISQGTAPSSSTHSMLEISKEASAFFEQCPKKSQKENHASAHSLLQHIRTVLASLTTIDVALRSDAEGLSKRIDAQLQDSPPEDPALLHDANSLLEKLLKYLAIQPSDATSDATQELKKQVEKVQQAVRNQVLSETDLQSWVRPSEEQPSHGAKMHLLEKALLSFGLLVLLIVLVGIALL
ncbi:MAG: hypothetical protein FJZ58_06370 [Chlamydiae bacterium]|nr:hypothetical protein [Chlamydiota bacterium]